MRSKFQEMSYMDAELLYMEMCSNFNFAFLKLSHQPLKHRDLPENENKKEGLNYWPKNLTESHIRFL